MQLVWIVPDILHCIHPSAFGMTVCVLHQSPPPLPLCALHSGCLSLGIDHELIPSSSPVSPPPFRLSTSGQLADSSDMVLLALDARQRAAELSRGAAGCRSVLQLCVGGVGGAGATLYQYITMRHLFPRQTQRTIN